MTELEKAARQALEALEGMTKDLGRFPEDVAAITALRQALENHESAYQRGYLDGMAKPCIDCADRKLQAFKQPKQEPVAWRWWVPVVGGTWAEHYSDEKPVPVGNKDITPLYTEPPKREWVGLTPEERFKIWEKSDLKDPFSFAVDVEVKLKEKNNDRT